MARSTRRKVSLNIKAMNGKGWQSQREKLKTAKLVQVENQTKSTTKKMAKFSPPASIIIPDTVHSNNVKSFEESSSKLNAQTKLFKEESIV